jgi:hypothetical protein
MSEPIINARTLTTLLGKMDAALSEANAPAQRLCVFGAAAILLHGSLQRQTQDIDVWRSASSLNDRALAEMARAAGMDLNPTDVDPGRIYLQIVREGVVKLPAFANDRWPDGRSSDVLWTGAKLTIEAPPADIIAAAKMVRCDDVDLEDVMFLIAKKLTDLKTIAKALTSFPMSPRRVAEENLVLLRTILLDPPTPQQVKKNEGPER